LPASSVSGRLVCRDHDHAGVAPKAVHFDEQRAIERFWLAFIVPARPELPLAGLCPTLSVA